MSVTNESKDVVSFHAAASIDLIIGGAIVLHVTSGDTYSVELGVSTGPVGLCATE